ncbi:MAG: 3-hydroxyacyl-CoA dehydrogenase family protein [Flavitalea sp.]
MEKVIPGNVEIIWADTLKVLMSISDIDVYFDLLFDIDNDRIERLHKIRERPVFINSVNYTLSECGSSFIRINAWPTMLKRDLVELAANEKSAKEIPAIFQIMDWKYQLVPDIPGMVTPRIIAMIINEAYYTLEQNVSTKKEIDIAMKLGTNYPLGPFEWSEKIGLQNIYTLLRRLSVGEPRYQPSLLLQQEASANTNLSPT